MKFLLLLTLISSFAHARWATVKDLSYKMIKDHSVIEINEDASNVSINTYEFEILKDNAKEKFSLYSIPFNATKAKLEVIEAKVRNGDEILIVPQDKIVERSPGKKNGLDNSKEIQIAFPKIQVGSKVSLKYKVTREKMPLGNFFSAFVTIGDQTQVDDFKLEINSKIKLFYTVNDPFKNLVSSKDESNKIFKYSFSNQMPHLREVVEEMSILNKDKFTFIRISTEENWNQLSDLAQKGFESVLKNEKNAELKSIAELAKKYPTMEKKVDYFLAYIASNFNYLGDWRTMEGGFAPRNLKDILETKYGDCKDFSTLLVYLLRESGLKANVALVHRSTFSTRNILGDNLPGVDLFNHAIVLLEDKDKKYWLDPTNPSSFALSHRSDISGKESLVLDGSHRLLNIPPLESKDNTLQIVKNLDLTGEDSVNVEANLKMSGAMQLLFSALSAQVPKEKMNEAFVQLVSQGESALLPEISDYDLLSKNYTPLNLQIKYRGSKISHTVEGKNYFLLPDLSRYLVTLGRSYKNWEGDAFIGEPQRYISEVFVKGLFVKSNPQECGIKTEWVDLKREFELLENGLKIKDLIDVKVNKISQEKFKSTDLELLQIEVSKCMSSRLVEFDFNNKKHLQSGLAGLDLNSLSPQERVKKRHEIHNAWLEDKNDLTYKDIIKLMISNIQDDPKDKKSYISLAISVRMDGYHSGDDFNKQNLLESQKVLSKALKIYPKDNELLILLARNLLYLNEVEKAKKIITFVDSSGGPKGYSSNLNYGRLFQKIEDTKRALHYLNSALNLASDNYEKKTVWFQLAVTATDPNECIHAYDQVLKYDPKDAFTHINVINCLVKAKRFDEAISRAKKGREITQAGMMTVVSTKAYNARGKDKLSKNDLSGAQSDFFEALSLRKEADTFINLATVSFHQQQYQKVYSILDEGVKYYEYDLYWYFDKMKSIFVNHFDSYLWMAKRQLEHTKDPSSKLWRYNEVGLALHKLQRREELYKIMEEGIKLGEGLVKAGRTEREILFPLGALYSLYGVDADNLELLAKAKDYLLKVKGMDPSKTDVDVHLNQAFRVEGDIKAGRIPASELNNNLKYIKKPVAVQ